MGIKNIELSTIRERYTKRDNDFIIRIREDSNDIVYYNGNKAFELVKDEEDKEKIKKIIIRDNIFNFNSKNIANIDINKLKEELQNSRKNIQKYTDIRILKSVTLQISANTYKKILNDKKEMQDFELRINKLQTAIEKDYEKYINPKELNIEKVKETFEKKLKNKKEQSILEYKIYLKNNTKFAIENTDKYIKDTISIEYLFIKECIFEDNNTIKNNSRFKIPQFYKEAIEHKENDILDLKELENEIKKAIDNYETYTKMDVEKKYQHIFMTSNILADKYETFKDIYRFEEEYYTDEGIKSNDKGRIDCVFVKINENISENELDAELYLIELKVDSKVIGGSNGVNKHLIDIEKITNNKKFITNLQKRINYRREVLKEGKAIKLNPNKIHFWTIIAISDKKQAKKVAKMLFDNLMNEEYIKNNMKKKTNKMPKESLVLNEQIKQVKDKEVDVKFLFDKWDYNTDTLSKEKLLEIKSFNDENKEKLLDMWN